MVCITLKAPYTVYEYIILPFGWQPVVTLVNSATYPRYPTAPPTLSRQYQLQASSKNLPPHPPGKDRDPRGGHWIPQKTPHHVCINTGVKSLAVFSQRSNWRAWLILFVDWPRMISYELVEQNSSLLHMRVTLYKQLVLSESGGGRVCAG